MATSYTCETVVEPLIEPRFCGVVSSPQSTTTLWMASPAGKVPTTMVNVAGNPAFGGVVGGVIVIGKIAGLTTTPVDTVTTVPKLSVSVPVIV